MQFLNRFNLYGKEATTHDVIKWIALIIMTIDHIGAYLYPDALWLRAIGRITFPVWFFLVGYSKHQKIDHYFIGIAMLVSIASAGSFYTIFPQNALVSIIFCRLFIRFLQKKGAEFTFKKLWLIVFIAANPIVFFLLYNTFEYGSLAICYALMGHLVRLHNDGHSTSRSTSLFYLFIYVLFIAAQFSVYPFDLAQKIFVVVGTAAVVWYLSRYTVRPVPTLSSMPALRGFITFTSRYSLEYYLVHRAAFQIASLWVNPQHQHVFSWINLS